jgi:dUTPase
MGTKIMKTPNYTEEMVTQLHALYAEQGNAGMDAIAETMGKTVRSVRAKLVRDGVYVAPEKGTTAVKKDGPSKKEMLAGIRALDVIDVDGFDGATKPAIAVLESLVKQIKALTSDA